MARSGLAIRKSEPKRHFANHATMMPRMTCLNADRCKPLSSHRFASPRNTSVLEGQAQAELRLAHAAGRTDSADRGRITERRTWVRQADHVENVGELSTELQRVAFEEAKVAEDGCIDVFIAGAIEQVARSKALSPGGRNDEGRWIEPLCLDRSARTMRTEDGIADNIGTVVVDTIEIDVGAGGDCEGCSAM
jgi:hypothetical protein